MTADRFITLAVLAGFSVLITSCGKDDNDDVISINEVSVGIERIMTIQDGDTIYVDAVDLGLPSELLWATCNLGAFQPSETGNYYAWGETAVKQKYSYDTYLHCLGDDFNFIKYVKKDPSGKRQERLAPGYECDNKTKLDSIDNAASAVYGGNWFMPTKRDFEELIYRTTRKYGKLNGAPGILFTSNVPGYQDRSIFFPLSGRKDYEKVYNEGLYGFYWASTLYSMTEADILWLDYKVGVPNVSTDTRERSLGLPVRPITYRE